MLSNDVGLSAALAQSFEKEPENPTPPRHRWGLIAVLVEENLLDDAKEYATEGERATLKERIATFAYNVQKRMPNSVPLIVSVGRNESPVKISRTLEKMYLEGVDADRLGIKDSGQKDIQEDENRLTGVILIGNVPLPVVQESDTESGVSLYPYTDFYRKRYRYDDASGKFLRVAEVLDPNPEIWHGVIAPTVRSEAQARQEIADYLYKNQEYSRGNPDYSGFSQRLLYANLPALEKRFNAFDYHNYQRWILYLEEFVYQRFNKHLLQDAIDRVTAERGAREMDADTIAQINDINTEFILRKYATPLEESLKTYLGRLNELVASTSRYAAGSFDSAAALVAQRDEYARLALLSANTELENRVNEKLNALQPKLEVVHEADLVVKVFQCPGKTDPAECSNVVGSQAFPFSTLLSGQKVSDIKSVEASETGTVADLFSLGQLEGCGLLLGQQPGDGQEVLENNSVLVEANRMYDPQSLVKPKNGLAPEDTDEYHAYAGCVFNNSQKYDKGSIHIGPNQCKPDASLFSLFDVKGSHEVEAENPGDLPGGRCDIQFMSFQPKPVIVPDVCKKTHIDPLAAAKQNQECIKYAYEDEELRIDTKELKLTRSLNTLTSNLYDTLKQQGKLLKPMDAVEEQLAALKGGIFFPGIKGNKAMQSLVQSGPVRMRLASQDGVFYEFSLNLFTTDITGMERHVEPRDSTIRALKQVPFTPSTPADGIRYTKLKVGSSNRRFEYLDLFGIRGSTKEEVSSQLKIILKQKDEELNGILGRPENLFTAYFINHTDLLEPLFWRQISLDQKLTLVMKKYLDTAKELLPVPPAAGKVQLPPVVRPAGGYEVWNLVARGDATGYTSGLNAALGGAPDPETEKARKEAQAALPPPRKKTEEESKCGGTGGVDIWKWYDNVKNCWYKEEIEPLAELLGFDVAESGSNPAARSATAFPPAVTAEASAPHALEASMPVRSLMPGQTAEVVIRALNKNGDPVIGVQAEAVKITLEDRSLGTLDPAEVALYTGEGGTRFTAVKEGETRLLVSMGELKATPLTVRVTPALRLNLEAAPDTSKPQGAAYTVTATLLGPTGERITDVNADVSVGTANPIDGVFAEGGSIHLTEGRGTTAFFPSPAAKRIEIRPLPPYEAGDPYFLTLPGKPVAALRWQASPTLNINTQTTLTLTALDAAGQRAEEFNGDISVELTDVSKPYAFPLASAAIRVQNGMGQITLKTKNETGTVAVIARLQGLPPAVLERTVLVRSGPEWQAGSFPKNLFASFIGFPAGDVLTEDFFGGKHLFRGSTEAVFAFTRVPQAPPVFRLASNYRLDLSSGRYAASLGLSANRLAFSVYDSATLMPFLKGHLPVNVSAVRLWEPAQKPEADVLYAEPLRSATLKTSGDSLELADGKTSVLTLAPQAWTPRTADLQFRFDPASAEAMPVLLVSRGKTDLARLHLSLTPRPLRAQDFETHASLQARPWLSGAGTADAAGLEWFDASLSVPDATETDENFGFGGNNRHLLLFAGGSPAGEAVRSNLPPFGILLGDPTVSITPRSQTSLGYDSTAGRQIFADPEGSGVSRFTQGDFTGDARPDLAAVMKDGRIRLLEGLPGDPPFRDRGDIAYMTEGVIGVEAFDLDRDGWDDLVLATPRPPATKNGHNLAILKNHSGVFSRENENLSVGRQIQTLLKGDLDADGWNDLVTLDTRGDIKAFYGSSAGFEAGESIGNAGLSFSQGAEALAGILVRTPLTAEPPPAARPPEPYVPGTIPAEGEWDGEEGVSDELLQKLSGVTRRNEDDNKKFDTSSGETQQSRALAQQEAVRAATEPKPSSTNTSAPQEAPHGDYLPWQAPYKPGRQTFFSDLSEAPFLKVAKTMSNETNPGAATVDVGDVIAYTITVQSQHPLASLELADSLPDMMTLNEGSFLCEGQGCGEAKSELIEGRLLFSGMDPRAGSPLTLRYKTTVRSTPASSIFLQKSKALPPYLNVVVSPAFGAGSLFEYAAVSKRQYQLREVPPQESASAKDPEAEQAMREYLDAAKKAEEMSRKAKECEKIVNEEIEKGLEPDEGKKCFDALAANLDPELSIGAVTTSAGPLPQESAAAFAGGQLLPGGPTALQSVSDGLSKVADAIDEYSCSGGGCFPMPWNASFPAPFYPVFAFPTTELGTLIPTPSIWPPSFLGASFFPGIFNSVFRIYVSESLTGGTAVAMCFGLWQGATPPPPPLFPVPYPPPWGNCIVKALPVSNLPPCKAIARMMGKLVRGVNQVITDVNTGIAAVNGNENLPVELQAGNTQGSGGLELSLSASTGKAQKFRPPLRTVQNIHIGSFDSLLGVISGWVDRQSLEIINKLFVLPTIYVYFPDVKNLFTRDFSEFRAILDSFPQDYSNAAQSGAQTFNDIQAQWSGPNGITGALSPEQKAKSPQRRALEALRGTHALVDRQASIYNGVLNPLQKTYELLNAIPFVTLQTQEVDIRIPWLSEAEANRAIREWKYWVGTMEREINRIEVLWRAIQCPDAVVTTPQEGAMSKPELIGRCAAQAAAQRFLTDIGPFIESVQLNIRNLEAWVNFPRKLVKYQAQLADYIGAVADDINIYNNLIGGWFAALRQDLVDWGSLFLTLYEIVTRFWKLFDLFINFDSSCDICTNERYFNPGWWTLLGLILPDLPVIKFPKWPDLVIDLSDVELEMRFDLPIPHLIAEPIKLPSPPFLRLPDIPDFSLLFTLPTLPVIMAPPDLPDLPPLPSIPTIPLPTLPPPPKLPDVGKAFNIIIPLIEQILNIWCKVKKAITPIPEGFLQDEINIITARPAYLIPLDLLKIKLPDIALFNTPGNQIDVKTQVHLGLRVTAMADGLQKVVEGFNKHAQDYASYLNDTWKKEVLKRTAELQAAADRYAAEIQQKVAEKQAEWQQKINSGLTDVELLEAADQAMRDAEKNNPLNQALKDAQEKLFNAFEAQAGKAAEGAPQSLVPPSARQHAQKIKEVIQGMATALGEAAANPVDAKALARSLDVSPLALDFAPDQTARITSLQKGLLAYRDSLMQRNKMLGHAPSLMALAEKAPMPKLPAMLAAFETKEKGDDERRYSSGNPDFVSKKAPAPAQAPAFGTLEKAFERKAKAAEESLQQSPGPGGCLGACLVDPTTGENVDFIPYFQDPRNAQTVFVPAGLPAGQAGKSHVAYSDAGKLYFKRDVTVPLSVPEAPPLSPLKVYNLDTAIGRENGVLPLYEAIDLIGSPLAENSAGSLQWQPVTNPDFYGVILEIRRSVLDFDGGRVGEGEAEQYIVLLPPEGDAPPPVLADGKPVEYGTLITGIENEQGVQKAFGLRPKNTLYQAKAIAFPGLGPNVSVPLNARRGVLVDRLSGSSYRWNAENAYYHVRMKWFNRLGVESTASLPELISPQPIYDAALPLDLGGPETVYLPILQNHAAPLDATRYLADYAGQYQYCWSQQGQNPVLSTERFYPVASDVPKTLPLTLRASVDCANPADTDLKKDITVVLYAPGLTLEAEPLNKFATAEGTLRPVTGGDAADLFGIPFRIFRQRWGTWKDLGKKAYLSGQNGAYSVSGWNTQFPSDVLIKDTAGKTVARVVPGTGQIELLDPDYELKAVPASKDLPTRVTVMQKSSGQPAAHVRYRPESDTDVVIRKSALTPANPGGAGVTLGDADTADDVVAGKLPGDAPSFPGGAAVFNNASQIVLALIGTDGAIRLLQNSVRLTLKNPGNLAEPLIFTLTDIAGKALFDIYMKPDGTRLQIDQNTVWQDASVLIGRLERGVKTLFAALEPSAPTDSNASPFSDVSTENPYYNQILDLYNRRIIGGYGDSSFRPEAKISRAEFVKVAMGATNCFDCSNPNEAMRRALGIPKPFPDVLPPAWYIFCIAIAKSLGMITGYGDGLFRPERNISRAEAAAVLLRQSRIPLQKLPEGYFRDVPGDAWYADHVYTAVGIGLIKNNGGEVKPDSDITRGEFAFMARTLLDVKECHDVDSDSDGLTDEYEAGNELNPLLPDDATEDTDKDGLTALQEKQLGTRADQYDTDGDGLSDGEEKNLGTDPLKADTDGDSLPDGQDVDPLKGGEAEEKPVGIPKPPAPPPACPCPGNLNQNDTDSDGTIDACDADIDGDSRENALCLFGEDGLLPPGGVGQKPGIEPDREGQPPGRGGEGGGDNCPFVANPSQADADGNGTGNACETEKDLCPEVPEDLDGVQDADGCPEADYNFPAETPGVIVNKGPRCGFLDYAADLVPGDILMTAITQKEDSSVIFSQSPLVQYQPSSP